MDMIDKFLAQWREKAYQFYSDLYQEYKTKTKEIQSMTPNRYDFYHLPKEQQKKILDNKDNYEQQYREYSRWKYSLPQIIQTMFGWSEKEAYKRLNKSLDKEVIRKKISLIKRVEKKIGNILDTSNLRIGMNGELNGYIIGEQGKVSVETISAGGYNIQCYHYRVLVKDIK